MADNLKLQLFNLELLEAQAAKVHSRLRLELGGEMCTKFFFMQMEKRKNAKQDMHSIKKIKDNKLLMEQTDSVKCYPKNAKTRGNVVGNFQNSLP